jgi:hypothetical protein
MAVEDIKEGDGYNFNYQVDSKLDDVHFSHNEDRRGYRTKGATKHFCLMEEHKWLNIP